MAIGANTCWEIRPAGSGSSDNNGGGFNASAAGTDRSTTQDGPFVAIDNATITATTAGANSNVLTITGYTPVAADVGNVFQAISGTNITPGFYEITVSGAGSWTVTGVGNLTGAGGAGAAVVGNMGGALASIAKAVTAANGAMTRSNKVFVKDGGAYSTTATITLSATGGTPGPANPANRLIGYTTTRGDGGRATITLSTNTGLTALNVTTAGWVIENFVIDCAGLGTSTGVVLTSNFCTLRNCLVKNFTVKGVGTTSTVNLVEGCEVTGGTAAASQAVLLSASNNVVRCYVHDNACLAVVLNGNSCTLLDSVVVNNTGASSDGVPVNAGGMVVLNNTVYANGRHGVFYGNNGILDANVVRNNVLAKNAGWQLNGGTAGSAADPNYDGNALWNSGGLGTRTNADDVATNPVNGVSPYTNIFDVILTADPFVNAAGGDFRLAPGAARASAVSTFPGLTQTTFADMGALQHKDSGAHAFGPGSKSVGGYIR